MNIIILLTISLLLASFNAQSAVTACPSGWTKSADGSECVLETKTTQTPNQVSNTAKPVCISGFTYSSTSMKCEQINNASTYNSNKSYAYMGALRFGPNPQEEYKCLSGGVLVGTNCEVEVNKVATAWSGCNAGTFSGGFYQGGQDWYSVQGRCNGSNLEIYADAAGSWGNGGTAGYWRGFPIGNYGTTYTHITTPSWYSQLQAFAVSFYGGCSNGVCSYEAAFSWAEFGINYNYCTWEYSWWNDSYTSTCQNRTEWFHTIYSSYNCDNEGNCSSTTANDVRNALNSGLVRSGFDRKTTFRFEQNVTQYGCPSGSYERSGKCIKTYPATK
jgi:hypothetical protein